MPTTLSRATLEDVSTLQNAATATGNGTLLDVRGAGAAVVQVVISASATVTFEVSLDDATWVSALAANQATGAVAATTTASGDFLVPLSGQESFRARVSTFGSGTITVLARPVPIGPGASAPSAVTGTVTANQGTAGAGAWPVKGAGTAGSADTGVVTVQGIASGTSQPVAALPAAPAAANILNGYQTFSSTTGATTLVTVPQGRTWVGVVAVNCALGNTAANTSASACIATVTTAGTNVTPAAGTVFVVRAEVGGGAAGGTAGVANSSNSGPVPVTVIAPAGNAVTVQVAATISAAATQGNVDASAIGQLI